MRRIIPCLDVFENQVVKGIKFENHEVMGNILELALKYIKEEADELVFYDISASSDSRTVDYNWVKNLAKNINKPFCVAGGINSLESAQKVFKAGADKISINSPAIENPKLIEILSKEFGTSKIVIGVDSYEDNGNYYVYQYTGRVEKTKNTGQKTENWLKQVEDLGAGEVVLNCMNQDGVRKGYDITQLAKMADLIKIPLIASGGAGKMEDFKEVFEKTKVAGALAASVFHKNIFTVAQLKKYLNINCNF